MSSLEQKAAGEDERRALIAVDLGASSCRVSLLRWSNDTPSIELVHRFSNAPVTATDGSLRWPLASIIDGVEYGLQLCAELASEGVQSIGVDGWAVDYVRLGADGHALEEPFCYRDERNEDAERKLHGVISAERLRSITGLQPQKLNTVYQLYADRLAGKPNGLLWLNLPEYLLSRWSGVRISEYSNATHTGMLDVATGQWSEAILSAADIDPATMPQIVDPGTVLGPLLGPLAALPAFRETQIIAPACHDTASAVAGIPASGDDWGYISCGTWSLVGTPSDEPHSVSSGGGFTNIGLDREQFLFQKNLNGLWLLSSCQEEWAAAGRPWETVALCAAAREVRTPVVLLDLEDPELQGVGGMLDRINHNLRAQGGMAIDASPASAPVVASLIFHSLAACYARTFRQLEAETRKTLRCIYIVGGGSRNAFLRELIAQATGKEVVAGATESSTLGNFAIQLAALSGARSIRNRREYAHEAARRLATIHQNS